MISCLSAGFFENIGKIFSSGAYLKMIGQGFLTTLIVSAGAAVVGLLLGTLVAMVRIQPKGNKWLVVPRIICDVYTTIVRGTPMALQLFIMAFVIFAIRGFPMEVTAIIAFGINSGAYVSENIRAGLLSVDKGQTEASRALGVGTGYTMVKIVIPQGMKNVIPAIGNELIALIKETSIVSMIGMVDLTAVAKIIGSGQNLATYLAPMLVVAMFYLAIVYLLTLVIKLIERRLRKGERR
ncbi:MAG: amino acid ABC transporter permease [Clostridia bacterium]|nr:amino acid ABC transporter permease [Clostridia bacterium]